VYLTASSQGAEAVTFGSCENLTERERAVLGRLAEGESNRQIAKNLAITPSTARTHTRNVLSKLGVSSRVLAIASTHPAHVPGPALAPGPESGDPISSLTRREREVLGCMAEGLARASIAARLNVSPNTVRTHVRNILAKLAVHSTPEAVALVAKRAVRV
jgi:DNA-binding CsgD family transcriptional regulator